MFRKYVGSILLLSFIIFCYGCSYVRSNATGGLASNLKDAVLNYNDLETVKDGGPAYLLMIDGLLLDAPDNEGLLVSAAALYSAYTGVFVSDGHTGPTPDPKITGLRTAGCLRASFQCL